MKKILFLTMLLFNFSCFSYSIFTLKNINWTKVKTVDVFIAGFGHEMGFQFLFSAITRAQVHDDLYPDSRAQVIMWAKESSKSADASALKRRGFSIMEVNSRNLSNEVIAEYLSQLPSISSLHIVSHSAAFLGNAIQKSAKRLGHDNFPWEKFRNKFTVNSYVYLHGCNTGFIVAPGISKRLERPVFGSLTSTDFQEIFSNDNWYHNNDNTGQFPNGMRRSPTSGELYNETLTCWKGNCHRMMPNNHPYRGFWGRYDVGLPYYQAFCNFGASNSCRNGISHALYTTPSIGAKSWEDKVMDHMCPRMADPSIFQNCVAILKGEESGRIFRGRYLACSRSSCEYRLVRGRNRNGSAIQNFTGRDAGVAQMQKDFNFFMGLEML